VPRFGADTITSLNSGRVYTFTNGFMRGMIVQLKATADPGLFMSALSYSLFGRHDPLAHAE